MARSARATVRYFAEQAYTMAIRMGLPMVQSGNVIAVYHQGTCFVWYRGDAFDGVHTIAPAKCWLYR